MVMYRDFAQRKGRALKLVGEAKNMKDGTVQVVAEGPRRTLETFLEELEKGPFLAKVEEVETHWFPALGSYTHFSIVYE